nr:uncharacterized protein LOC108178205 isoform X1 [Oryctolagus cuniculus]
MGNTPSTTRLSLLLSRLSKTAGTPVKAAIVCAFTRTVAKVSPWFVEKGDLHEDQWKRVGRQLRAAGEPSEMLRLWQLVEQALNDPSERIGALLDKGAEILENLQRESSSGSQMGDQEEQEGLRCAEKDRPPPTAPQNEETSGAQFNLANLSLEDRPGWRSLTLSKGEALGSPTGDPTLEGGSHEPRSRRGTGRERNAPNWEDYHQPGQVFPVIMDAQGNRESSPLDHKLLKKLQKAVQLYGPHANFTKAVLKNIGTQGLIPDDWKNLAKAVLGGGDFLLWAAAYRELAVEQARYNAQNGQPA